MKLLRECTLLLIIAAAPALLSAWLHPKRPELAWARPGVSEINLKDTTNWPQPILWIDARIASDYERRHIPGAISLNEDAWEQLLPPFLASWQPGTTIVVYCDSQKCDASKEVARRLQRELKLEHVYVLKGGWQTWLASNP